MHALSDLQRSAVCAAPQPRSDASGASAATRLVFRRRVEAPACSLVRREWGTAPVEQLSVELPGSVHAGAGARQLVGEMAAMVMDERERDMLKLLVTELVNNAVEHGGARAGHPVVLRLGLSLNAARAEVCDCGGGFDAGRLPDRGEGPGGRGLVLLDSFASRWGSTTDEETCVWFEIDR